MNKKLGGAGEKNEVAKGLGMVPPIGNYLSRKEWENACWRKVSESKELLNTLTTSHERHNLAIRAAAIQGLASGKSYREISKELFISTQTVSSIKKALSEKTYRSYPERSEGKRKKKEHDFIPSRFKPKHRGRPVRTKYGTIYLPN